MTPGLPDFDDLFDNWGDELRRLFSGISGPIVPEDATNTDGSTAKECPNSKQESESTDHLNAEHHVSGELCRGGESDQGEGTSRPSSGRSEDGAHEEDSAAETPGPIAHPRPRPSLPRDEPIDHRTSPSRPVPPDPKQSKQYADAPHYGSGTTARLLPDFIRDVGSTVWRYPWLYIPLLMLGIVLAYYYNGEQPGQSEKSLPLREIDRKGFGPIQLSFFHPSDDVNTMNEDFRELLKIYNDLPEIRLAIYKDGASEAASMLELSNVAASCSLQMQRMADRAAEILSLQSDLKFSLREALLTPIVSHTVLSAGLDAICLSGSLFNLCKPLPSRKVILVGLAKTFRNHLSTILEELAKLQEGFHALSTLCGNNSDPSRSDSHGHGHVFEGGSGLGVAGLRWIADWTSPEAEKGKEAAIYGGMVANTMVCLSEHATGYRRIFNSASAQVEKTKDPLGAFVNVLKLLDPRIGLDKTILEDLGIFDAHEIDEFKATMMKIWMDWYQATRELFEQLGQ